MTYKRNFSSQDMTIPGLRDLITRIERQMEEKANNPNDHEAQREWIEYQAFKKKMSAIHDHMISEYRIIVKKSLIR